MSGIKKQHKDEATGITVITNNQPRELLMLSELTDKERADFDYVTGEDQWSPRFVRYIDAVYDIHEFSYTNNLPAFNPLKKWDGMMSDTFFSGVVMRFPSGGDWLDDDHVIMGRFYS